MSFEPEAAVLVILDCALKHGISREEIENVWRNPYAMRYRNFEIPSTIAAAGIGLQDTMVEILGSEQENEEIVIFHVMKLTRKMAYELGL